LALQSAVKAQGELIAKLKADNADKQTIGVAVDQLKKLKTELDTLAAEIKAANEAHLVFRRNVEDVLLRRFFYVNSFEIYGGIGGLFDFGPPGCALKDNIIELWRQHFVLTESMLEVSCTCVTPEIVLKTSGHVDKFTDFMVTDAKTGECFRADKLVEAKVDELLADPLHPVTPERKAELLAIRSAAGDLPQAQLAATMRTLDVRNPNSGSQENPLSDPYPFNLMFATSIGPTGKVQGYLRPETAQGIFVNFRRLYDFNNGQMPFACAQIGLAFRNEIAPRSGLLRVREFPMMEIEHFCNPTDKSHHRFQSIANVRFSLLDRKGQTGEDVCLSMTAGEAVEGKVINNQTLAYFMARTQLFLHKVGINPEKLRFRQHKANEMAHYAQDCWDAEIHTSYGWIECVGHADRSAYDLQVHSNVSQKDLSAREDFKVPQKISVPVAKLNNAAITKAFGKAQAPVRNFFKNATEAQLLEVKAALESGDFKTSTPDGPLIVTNEIVQIAMQDKVISGQKYIPSVIEPSFGLGRIMYSALEHAFREREGVKKDGESQSYLALSPYVAPVKTGVLLQSQKQIYLDLGESLTRLLVDKNLTYRLDDSSASLGRKYARADEIGIPYSIVIDLQSDSDQKCTIRDRDSTQQVRVTFERACELVWQLCKGRTTWAQVYATEVVFLRPEASEEKTQ